MQWGVGTFSTIENPNPGGSMFGYFIKRTAPFSLKVHHHVQHAHKKRLSWPIACPQGPLGNQEDPSWLPTCLQGLIFSKKLGFALGIPCRDTFFDPK